MAHASDNVFKRSEPELLLGFPRAGRVALGLVEVVETFHVIVTHGRGGGSVVVERGRGLKMRMQVDGMRRRELVSLQTVMDEVEMSRNDPEGQRTQMEQCGAGIDGYKG